MTRSPWLHVLCTITCAALSVVASLCALATLADGAVAVAVACSVLAACALGALFALVAVEERDDRARRALRVAS